MPVKQGPEKSLLDLEANAQSYQSHIVNRLRVEVGSWRRAGYPNATRTTRELLAFWFDNPERADHHRLFFAQREAVESAVWLNEIADLSNSGTDLLRLLAETKSFASADPTLQLPRIAFKMATGTGKTVVMAMLILYHFANRREARSDTRFVDVFLVVTPGITIKERLNVLFVDRDGPPNFKRDYYHVRGLVPAHLEPFIDELNNRIVVTNFHAFEPKVLSGNKRSPFDGKLDASGKRRIETENPALVVRRLVPFRAGSRLLIINDEGHHCYLPKAEAKSDAEEREENERAAVWYTGLLEVTKRFKVPTAIDLSATPYFLSGSGYPPYSLFPWVVSDFNLVESIESGLVKIPYLPESDPTHNLDMPVLRNLYEHVRDALPKSKKSSLEPNRPPELPPQLKNALDQLYSHYEIEVKRARSATRAQRDLFLPDPVFIVVCSNTGVSSEVYRYIAGYEIETPDGDTEVVAGAFELFSNYDGATRKPRAKPPTLLIDSVALEESEQINDDFKRIFAPEIERFKRDYCAAHNVSAETITDGRILREVVNTVGKPGELGSHVRCVVSVSMLTEGWDANTVTHVLGVRAFGSQLLCEQVAGRALRRISFALGDDGKLNPEYAMIAGIPFTFFSGGANRAPDPKPTKQIRALPERQERYEITFPNLDGYRVETSSTIIEADFSSVDDFEIDGSKYPSHTVMASPISPDTVKLTLEQVKTKRPAELVYLLVQHLIRTYYVDVDGNREFHLFAQLKSIVEQWYETKVRCIGSAFKKMLFYENPDAMAAHVYRAITAARAGKEVVLPIFNFYNREGSTRFANGITTRAVFATTKSHVNYVVADTESWEQIAAKTLEELDAVESYVKNAYLGFTIPYVAEGSREARYFPDFIARCRTPSGKAANLIIEITGMNKDKTDKRHYVEHYWLPAVNGVRERFGWNEWAFLEIANDIRDIRGQIEAKIEAMS